MASALALNEPLAHLLETRRLVAPGYGGRGDQGVEQLPDGRDVQGCRGADPHQVAPSDGAESGREVGERTGEVLVGVLAAMSFCMNTLEYPLTTRRSTST